MKKQLCTIGIGLLAAGNAHAQVVTDADKVKPASSEYANTDTTAWVYGGIFNLGGNEGFLHNWPAGGELASLTTNGIFSAFLTYLNGRNIWTNNLDLNYGLNYAYSYSFIPRKTDDRIDFTSKFGRRLHPSSDAYLTGLFNFRSQFTQGYDYKNPEWRNSSTSRFFSPAYFTLAPGLELRKGTNISLFLSPAAARLTCVDRFYTDRDPKGAFGVDNGKTTRFEFGAYLSARYQVNINKNISFRSRLDLYTNYLAKDSKDSLGNVLRRDNPGNIMVLSDNLFSYKVGKHISITLGMVFIYDHAVPYESTFTDASGIVQDKKEPMPGLGWLQVKQNLNFGLEYKLPLPKKEVKQG
jgi:hypothetical protein